MVEPKPNIVRKFKIPVHTLPKLFHKWQFQQAWTNLSRTTLSKYPNSTAFFQKIHHIYITGIHTFWRANYSRYHCVSWKLIFGKRFTQRRSSMTFHTFAYWCMFDIPWLTEIQFFLWVKLVLHLARHTGLPVCYKYFSATVDCHHLLSQLMGSPTQTMLVTLKPVLKIALTWSIPPHIWISSIINDNIVKGELSKCLFQKCA